MTGNRSPSSGKRRRHHACWPSSSPASSAWEFPARANVTDITDAVCSVAAHTRVELVLVDEIHTISLATRAGAEVSDQLKYFAERYLQLNRGRSERVSGGLEIPGIASWMGLPSVVQHGAGGIDEGAAGVDAGHGVRVVDGAGRGPEAGGAGRAVLVVSGVDREVAEHDQGVCTRPEGLDDVSGPSGRRLAGSAARGCRRIRRLAAVAAARPRRPGGGATDRRIILLGNQ